MFKKGLLASIVAMVAVMFSLLFLPANKVEKAEEANNNVNYSWMINGNTAFKSNIDAGSAQGYNDYVIGDENVVLSATANPGFKLVGWNVKYLKGVAEVETTAFLTTTSSLDSVGYPTLFTLGFNGNNGTLTISRVADEYEIEPVFDYIYYNLDVSQMFGWLGKTNTSSQFVSFNSEVDEFAGYNIYYGNKTTSNGVTTYSNAIVNKIGEEGYLYVGQLFATGTADLFTKHLLPDGSGLMQNINLTNGAFRANEEINFNYNLFVSDNYGESVNLDVNGFDFVGDGNQLLYVANNGNKDVSGRTVNLRFDQALQSINNLNSLENKTLKLNVEADKLYYVEVLPYVDDNLVTTTDGENQMFPTNEKLQNNEVYSMLLKYVVGNFAYYTFPKINLPSVGETNTARFLVKDAAHNGGVSFVLSGYDKTITYYENYATYNYYNFKSISVLNFENINENTFVKLNYSSVFQTINFKPAVFDENGVAREISGVPTQHGIALTRGEVANINNEDNPNLVGYEFYCFSTTLRGNVQNGSSYAWKSEAELLLEDSSFQFTAGIDYYHPTSITVYVVYRYVDYTIEVAGMNSISVDLSGTKYYPISNIGLICGSTTWKNSLDFVFNTTNNYYTTSFSSFNVSQTFYLMINNKNMAEKGFKIEKFVVNYSDDQGTHTKEYEVGQEFAVRDIVSSSGTTITIMVVESYEEYSINYQTNAGTIAGGGKTIMADISLAIGGQEIKITSAGATKNGTAIAFDAGETSAQTTITYNGRILNVVVSILEENCSINIDGLRLYDRINILAQGRAVSAGSEQVYQFIRFSLDGTSRDIAYDYNSATKEYYTLAAMPGDISITAVYTTPTASLAFFTKILGYTDEQLVGAEAFNLSNLVIVDENNERYTLDSNNFLELSVDGNYTVTVNQNNINAGYAFVEFITNLDPAPTMVGNSITFNLNTALQTSYVIELDFNVVDYTLNLAHTYSGASLTSEGLPTTKTINVINRSINFIMPQGYYISRILVQGATLKDNVLGNSYDSTMFDITLNNYEFESLVSVAVANTINLTFDYRLHTYTINIEFEVINGNSSHEITYPSINIKYAGVDETPAQTKNIYFVDLPYGTTVNFSAFNAMPGMKLTCWADKNGNPLISPENGRVYVESYQTTILQDVKFIYKIEFVAYTINVFKEGVDDGVDKDLAGNPYVKVNGYETNQIYIYDRLQVFSGAQKVNGYTFSKFYYRTYVPYTYSAEQWESEYLSLYTIENGRYKQNYSMSYNPTKTYYKAVSNVSTSSVYIDLSFHYLNYDLLDATEGYGENSIIITVVYGYLEITVSAQEELVGSTVDRIKTLYFQGGGLYQANNDNNDYYLDDLGVYYVGGSGKRYLAAREDGNIVVEVDEYGFATVGDGTYSYPLDSAENKISFDGDGNILIRTQQKINYTLNALDIDVAKFAQVVIYADGEEYDGGVLTRENTIELFVYFNTIKFEGVDVNLADGIKIEYLKILSRTVNSNEILFVKDDNGKDCYYFSFNLSTVLMDLNNEDSDNVRIVINYSVKQKSLSYSTNIKSASFYKPNVITLTLLEDATFGNRTENLEDATFWAGGDVQIVSYMQFMAKATLTYQLHTSSASYIDYFDIVGVRLILPNGQVVEGSSRLVKYGVFVTSYDGTISKIECRYLDDYKIELILQPKLNFAVSADENEEYHFKTTYKFALSNGGTTIDSISQGVSIGVQGQLDKDITVASWFEGYVDVEYRQKGFVVEPADVGVYQVIISFASKTGAEWLAELELEYKIFLEIEPAELYIVYDNTEVLQKQYDRTYALEKDEMLPKMQLNTKENGSGYDLTSFFNFTTDITEVSITTTVQGAEVETYNVSEYTYNLTINNLALNNSLYLKNFALSYDIYTAYNAVKINKRPVYIIGLEVKDKVFDGTTKADLASLTNLRLNNVVSGDDLMLDYVNITPTFETSTIGKDIAVSINMDGLLVGYSAPNYEIMNLNELKASIYPYSLQVNIPGYGDVVVKNERGKTDVRYVNLIPIGAKLVVSAIEKESAEYSNIYSSISKFISNTNVYSVGYKIELVQSTNGAVFISPVNNMLYLELPNVGNLSQVLYIDNQNASGEIDYVVQGDRIIVDLSNVKNVDKIALMNSRTMLVWWQIALIVGGVVALIGGGLAAFFIIRHKKLKMYSSQEKI